MITPERTDVQGEIPMNMNKNVGCCGSSCHAWLYTAFRIIVGGLFMWHGIGKLMDWSTASRLMQTAGVIETLSGALILLGLYTSYAAVAGAIVMIVAFLKVHVGLTIVPFVLGNWNPMANKGELALIYLAAFLVLHAHGNGSFSVGNLCKSSCDCECSGSCAVEAPVAKKASAKKKR